MIDNLLLDVADVQICNQGLLKSIAPTVAPVLRNIVTAVVAVLDFFFTKQTPTIFDPAASPMEPLHFLIII
jgi:hypothetical protein